MGGASPNRGIVSVALNEGLGHAGVLRLEDPIEDLFCDHISTTRGDFRIFTGLWEGAGPYTQTLLNAFETLPAGRMKDRVLTSVYALLRLSDALAERAGVDRSTVSSGTPNGDFPVPSAEELKRLSRRVRFSDGDLIRLNIDKNGADPISSASSANAPADQRSPSRRYADRILSFANDPIGYRRSQSCQPLHRPSRAPCERGKRRWHGRSPSICFAP